MQVRENRFGNFVVIQLFDSEAIAPKSVLDVRFESNFNKVRIAIAHVAEMDSQSPIVYLTPRKRYNRNAYVVILGTRTGSKPLYLRFKFTPEGIEFGPATVVPEETVGQAYAQLLMSDKTDGTHAFGLPGRDGLPAVLAIQLVLGDDQFKFIIGVAEKDAAVDPRPFAKLLANLKRPLGPIKKKLAQVIAMSSTKP